MKSSLLKTLTVMIIMIVLLLSLGCSKEENPVDPNNNRPVVEITNLAANASFSAGDTITFTGTATDTEDGVLEGTSLVWTSNQDGTFGTGVSRQNDTLSVNTHIIILTATDSEGAEGSDSVTIIISNVGGAYGGIDFAGFIDLVEEIAPPVYNAPIGAPAGESDSMWNTGENSLLGKVFSETEPMSLYANMNNLDNFLSQISEMSSYIENIETANDTIITIEGQQGFTIELVNLTSATVIPETYIEVFWTTSFELDQLIKLEQTGGNNPYSMHCGYTLTETSQTILVYHTMSDGTIDESSLFYAHVNLVDSSIAIRSTFYKGYGDNTTARWVYQIFTVDESNFGYRMSWYADLEASSLLGCIVGGGNKDDEFAMLYRQFIPADTAEWDSSFVLDQIFDANFGLLPLPEWGLGTAVYEGDIFTYDAMPSNLILSPWTEQ